MRLAPFSLLLLACGPVKLDFASVDPEWVEDFDALADGLANELGHEVLTKNGGFYTIVVNEAAIRQYGAETKIDVMAFQQGFTLTMLHKDHAEAKSCGMARAGLAHEIGHLLLGPGHDENGLMAPIIDPTCKGFEVQCLIDALRKHGLK